jgi:hypothetical protein
LAEASRQLTTLGLRFVLGLAVVLAAVGRAVAAMRVEPCEGK